MAGLLPAISAGSDLAGLAPRNAETRLGLAAALDPEQAVASFGSRMNALDAAVDIVLFQPALPLEALSLLRASLAEEERRKAGSFRSERDRLQRIAISGMTRAILAGYLGRLDPGTLRFGKGPKGKPFLLEDAGPEDRRLAFSVAHSGAWSALAVTRTGAVGIDLEEVPSARATLRLLEGGADDDAVRLWVRREAAAKMDGDGDLEIETAHSKPIAREASWMHEFVPAPDYLGAVSLRRPVNARLVRILPGASSH